MKNVFMFISIMCISMLNGMDQLGDFSFKVNDGTIIEVNKKSIADIDGKVDVIATSFDKQLFFSGERWRRPFRTTDVRRVRNNILKTDKTEEKKMKSTAVVVVEPIYNNKPFGISFYERLDDCVKKRDNELQEQRKRLMNELAVCYENVLSRVANQLDGFKHNGTIAIESLGSFVGFPSDDVASVAVKTAVDFANKNPETYAVIYLLVKEDSDLATYKKWVDEYMAQLIQKK